MQLLKIVRDNPWFRMLAITCLLFSIVLTSGCSGCRNSDSTADKDDEDEDEKEKKKKKKKPDFQTRSPILLPGLYPLKKEEKDEEEDEKEKEFDPLKVATEKMSDPVIRYNRTKLGHWVTAHFQIIANNYNAEGQLNTNSLNAFGKPVGVPSTDYFLATTRPASLPKGEWKNLETTIFLPRRNTKAGFANVSYALDRSGGGLIQHAIAQPTTVMKPCQYHIVLLSSRPGQFNFLKMSDSIHLRSEKFGNGASVPPFYYIVPSTEGNPVPLPRHALNWTTIAYLIWDDYDPELITQEHQDAILDWLHFGGQLILSGPDCLDKLQGSFLADYLPAHFEASRNITNADLETLNENWSVPVAKNEAEETSLVVSDSVPLLGVEFKPHTDARFIDGTGDMAIERQLGRGRIIMTSFSLSAPVVRKWRSFSSFLNCALLRRPSRVFGKTDSMSTTFGWEDDRTSIFDPLIGTTLRFVSRDLSPVGTPESPNFSMEDELSPEDAGYSVRFGVSPVVQEQQLKRATSIPRRDPKNQRLFGGFSDAPQSGPGGWNDDSGVAMSARETLQEAAGITPPSSGFVLKMLAAYLLVLVPLNWLLFRLMGKVEWAWAAAPIIAVVGALLVVKMASLDIGFVRSNTQIGVLEIHGDYPRAHIAEYSALYTSLSTRYNVDLDNLSTQSLPFARVSESKFYQKSETLSKVNLRRTVQNRLEGFQIKSNSTGLLHTESMIDLQGTISCSFNDDGKPETITNGSVLNLRNTGVVWQDQSGVSHLAWIGELAAGSVSADLDLVEDSKYVDSWRNVGEFANASRAAEKIWNDYFPGTQKRPIESVSYEEIEAIAELKPNWEQYERLFNQALAQSESGEISRQSFFTVYENVNSENKVRMGRVFDVVADNLAMAPGECRLYASTDESIGRTKFDPEATQTDQQTLVLVHLQHPKLPVAKRDSNSLLDFKGKSSLDWENEMKELDSLFEPGE